MPPKQATSANRPQRERKTITVFQPTMKGDRKILREEGIIMNSTATLPTKEYAIVERKEEESSGSSSEEEDDDDDEQKELKIR